MSVLKDNSALNFAVVTGCLQIVKESIFTGTNNFVSDTISDSRLEEYFGFTPAGYWEHTSHNDIIYQFISTTEADINDKFETLLSGGYIIEPIEPNLTYDILHFSEKTSGPCCISQAT